MILLSHPTGNENVRQTARAFQEANLLGEFWTCLSWPADAPAHRFLPAPLRRRLSRRSFHPLLRPLIRTVPAREMGRLFAEALGVSAFSEHETGPFSIDAVYAHLDGKVAARVRMLPDCRAVYAYEDGALQTFRAAKERNIPRVYDLPIGYWRHAQQIYAEEREREPEWAMTLSGSRDSAEKLARKDEELQLATRVMVASSFTRETLGAMEFPAAVTVIPYGAPPVEKRAIVPYAGNLRVLYVGSLGQRKGLSYLLGALALLGPQFELTLLGKRVAPGCRPLEEALRRHHWIPTLPHGEVLAQMRRHDVLVLPSLFEGFGLVLLEAMAQGLPVIATAHTAGPDFISEGVDGFIVPIRSAQAIAERLELLARDRERLCEMQKAAALKAESQRWDSYRQGLVRVAREVVAKGDAVLG